MVEERVGWSKLMWFGNTAGIEGGSAAGLSKGCGKWETMRKGEQNVEIDVRISEMSVVGEGYAKEAGR